MITNENNDFLTKQIITYIGNKRKLLNNIENEIINIKKELHKDKLITCDLFSGSGIVARMLKQHSSEIHTNDMEKYSFIINECYLSNYNEINWDLYNKYYSDISNIINNGLIEGIITENYAPKCDDDIKEGERVFYTHENAMIIDTINQYINEQIPDSLKSLFLAPLLYEASVHVNTSGVFKGFYKSKETKIGKFGGDGENALERILGKIELKMPILSNFNAKHYNYKMDSNELVKILPELDVIYIDPPYNQHPYGSNYFMLNTIINNDLGENISKVSGIPSNWNKSNYNIKSNALKSMKDLIKDIRSKYIIVSYNSEGFISYDEMFSLLNEKGTVFVKEIVYPTFRGCRNLKNRDKHVNEYIFICKVR